MPTRIISQPPTDVKNCLIYRHLIESAATDDGLCLKADTFIRATQPLMDQIVAGPFGLFTLHNRDHGKKVLHLMGELISADVLKALNPLECLILIYAAHLHDLGMLVTTEERQNLLISDGLRSTIEEWPELSDQISHERSELGKFSSEHVETIDGRTREQIEDSISQLVNIALCDHLRPHHADKNRYKAILNIIGESSSINLFEYNGVNYDDVVVEICWSHNQDPGILAEVLDAYEERFPRDRIVAGVSINTQFIAGLLRLADILDFDRERTPKSLLECLGLRGSTLPGSAKSLQEWSKHLAVHTLRCVDDELIVEADCDHPLIESAVREFCKLIERELRQTSAILKRNPPDIVCKYRLDFPQTVRARIKSRGYVFKDLSFRLHQSSIMSLLMGESLYQSPYAAIRELIQNSVDASDLANRIEGRAVSPVEINIEEIDGLQWLCVSDDGIGMDDHVLTEYFFNVGKSYYQSSEFRQLLRQKEIQNLNPVGRFGIGIVSSFMIGDVMIVETCRQSSPSGDTKFRRLTIDSRGGLAVVTERDSGRPGTKIMLRLRPEFSNESSILKMADYIKRTVIRPTVDVVANIGKTSLRLGRDSALSISEDGKRYLESINAEAIVVDVREIEPDCRGRMVLFFTVLPDRTLSHKMQSGNWLRIFRDIKPERALSGFVGNRVTVNGFVMSLRRASRIVGKKNSVPMVVDIDIPSRDNVLFSASRDKIVGTGKFEVRRLISRIAYAGVMREPTVDRLSEETRNLFTRTASTGAWEDVSENPNFPKHVDSSILDLVEATLPKDKWPPGMHQILAPSIGIPPGVFYRAVSILIDSGRAVNPNASFAQ